MIKSNELFEKRTKCLLFNASENSIENYGWIGGNSPAYFDDKFSLINTNIEHTFYLTLKNPINIGKAISIFIPKEYNNYLENNIYPNCSIKVFEHEMTDESNNSFFRNNSLNKHFLNFIEETETDEAVEKTYLIKFGGKPDFIQEETYYYEPLNNNGFNFLFQIDENGYPDNLLTGSYPFGYGGLYIYAKINGDIVNNILAGFWQYS
jgi:hypothetical protein